MKRLFDLLTATVTIVLFSPLIAMTAVCVRVFLGNPVVFRQQRPGQNGKPFTIYKFRTMTEHKDEQGSLTSDHDRLTRFGKFLRSTSLDELPELVNVLKGDMSIVGPRPLLMKYMPYFTETERIRFSVRPGMTGLAQISGRNALSWNERIALDVKYVNSWSLWLDLFILLRTVGLMFTRRGLTVDPRATMLDFDEERRQQGQGRQEGQ